MTLITFRILLVDDCLEDRETYHHYLLRDKQHKYKILEASTGEQALLLCRQQFPDVIVTDYLLPGMDGLDFLDHLKTQFGQTNLPVIILTGRGNEQIAVEAMKGGAADYLVKKDTNEFHFIKAVENVLEKTHLTKQLEQSDGRFQATFNSAAVGIAHVGLDGQCLLVNQKLCDIVGYSREELIRLTLEDITHPDDRNRDFEYVVRMLTGEIQTYSQEKRYIRQDNTQVWINLTVSLVHEASGDPQYFICVVEDITVRKQAQAALQQANLELERRMQQRTSELQQANQELQRTLEELQVTEEELRQQNEELAISRQAIELERQRYQDLFKFAPDGYLVTDIWGNIREANRAAATLLSIQQQRLIGKPMLIFIAEPERKAFRTRLLQLQEVQGWEIYLKPRSGDPFPAMVAVSSIHDEQGQSIGWHWLLRDISDRKQMEQQLQAAHDELEKRVEERTAALEQANYLLKQEITERKRREANATFLVEIAEDFSRLSSVEEIIQAIGVKIGAHLNVTACNFCEVDESRDMVVYLGRWNVEGVQRLPDRICLSQQVSEDFYRCVHAGETIVSNNTQTNSVTNAQANAAIEVLSFITVPFHKDGEWKYLFSIHDMVPRTWREDEIELVRELANQTFPRLERAFAEAAVAADLKDTQLLRDLSARLISEDNIQVLYNEIMAAAITLMRADGGTFQILDEATQELVLLASQGFDRTMTEHFALVDTRLNTPCSVALATGERSLIDFDVPESDDPNDHLRMHLNAGYLCAQSTPLISRSGRAIGMVSTHWRNHHQPSDSEALLRSADRELRFLDLLARQATDAVDKWIKRYSCSATNESKSQNYCHQWTRVQPSASKC